jgi:bla regulator protein BlaR1
MIIKARIVMLIVAGMATQTAAAQTTIRCTELADAANGMRLIHEGQCDERVTPASTFKIAISLMGYDSGILSDEHAPTLPFRKGYVDWNPAWRAATDPTGWMKHSVVWYSHQVTSKLGAARFQRYVKSFNYGNDDVSGNPGKNNGLTLAWINSSLKISPVEQVTFLRSVVNRNLPLTAKAYDMTFRILKLETLANGWEIYGKTGTGYPVLRDGTEDPAHAYGWFVGWATKGQRTIVFARLVQDQKKETGAAGLRVREAFLRDLPAQLDSL